jgi:hypothetical protein
MDLASTGMICHSMLALRDLQAEYLQTEAAGNAAFAFG